MDDDLITIAGETFDNTQCIVSEIGSDGQNLVPINPDVLKRVTAGDDDPRFATFVIESGWSKSRRYWGPELFADVASEMNVAAFDGEPMVGYMGHISPEADPYAFPEIQLQWVGAKLLERTADKAKLAVKAYVLPNTSGKTYLEKGIVRNVSWRGKIAQEVVKGGVKVKQFVIESIDLSRPRAAGMSARMVGALSSEMESEGGNSVKPEEIAALQENELRAHAPNLVATIEASARQPLETQVSEMTTAVEATAPAIAKLPEIRKALGLADDTSDENVLVAVVNYLREAGKSIRDSVLDSVLTKKFKDAKDTTNFALLRRAVVGEMTERDLRLTGTDTEGDERVVSEMVNSIIDGDGELTKVASEMAQTPPAPPTADGGNRNGDDRELKPGYKNSNIRVRAAS